MKKIINLDVTSNAEFLINCTIDKISNYRKELEISHIEIVWDSLTGTHNGTIKLSNISDYSETEIETININNSDDSKIVFLLNYLGKIKIEYTANLIASGEIKLIIYWRKKCN
jgi:hypothetical protein